MPGRLVGPFATNCFEGLQTHTTHAKYTMMHSWQILKKVCNQHGAYENCTSNARKCLVRSPFDVQCLQRLLVSVHASVYVQVSVHAQVHVYLHVQVYCVHAHVCMCMRKRPCRISV